MQLIIKSFFLSLGVGVRMIVPMLIISALSGSIWGILDAATGGYSTLFSKTITSTFTTLLGMRMALALLGDHRRTAFKDLILYSVLLGVFFVAAQTLSVIIPDVVTSLYNFWNLGTPISYSTLIDIDRLKRSSIGYDELTVQDGIALLLYIAVLVYMAVPSAGLARSAGYGSKSAGLLDGAGRSFILLYLIYTVSIFLQAIFGLFSFLFVMLPFSLAVISLLFTQTLPDFDPVNLMFGFAIASGLLWMQSWTWAAAALALVAHDKTTAKQRPTASAQEALTSDLRSLRKSRE